LPYKGVREIGYKDHYEKQDKLAELVKFGKKVYTEAYTTNEDLLKEHLKAVRDNMNRTVTMREQKRHEEQKFIRKLEKLSKVEQAHKDKCKAALNSDFLTNNHFLRENQERMKAEA
jgi:ribosomal protein S17